MGRAKSVIKMPSTKLENRILLCSVALGVSCGIGLIVSRELGKALITAAIATTASFIGATVVDRKTLKQERIIRNSYKNKVQALENEISQLESYENQLRQSLMTTTNVKQEIEVSLNDLIIEKKNLINQIEQLSKKQEAIQKELPLLSRQKETLEDACEDVYNQLLQISDRKKEFEQTLLQYQKQIQENQSCLTLLREEYQQMQEYNSEIYTQKQQLDDDLYELEIQKQQLVVSINDLQLHVCQLEAKQQSLTEPQERIEDNLLDSSHDESNISEDSALDWTEWNELLDSI
jgi:chromosome segregation ATPase